METELSTPRGKKLEKQGLIYSTQYTNKKYKMEYIGQTGRHLKIRMKKHELDLKFDFF